MVSTKDLLKYKIWVLAPYLHTDDPNIQYYYDFSQGIKEYNKVFTELNCEWQWQPVTMNDYKEIIENIRLSSNGKLPLVINLCDGDEINGTPGISVIDELKKHRILYTGSEPLFYDITTSKITMKQAFEKAAVPTPAWEVLDKSGENIKGLFERLGTPVIVKPAVSGGSMGITINNVVHNEAECLEQLNKMYSGYHGWELATGGVFAEQFITGREFTTLIVGSASHPDKLIFYPPVERVFHKELPETEKFLSFDRLWETYEEEKPINDQDYLYNYFEPEATLFQPLKEISIQAYTSVNGTGYGRLDIRMDKSTGKLYMLEVNAQCGLSEDEDYTSIGAILRIANKTFTQLTCEILEDAIQRHKH